MVVIFVHSRVWSSAMDVFFNCSFGLATMVFCDVFSSQHEWC